MANDHNFKIKNGLAVAGTQVIDSSLNIGAGGAADSSYDLKVHGLARFEGVANFISNFQVGGLTVITSSRNMQNIGNINIGGYYAMDGTTLIDASKNIINVGSITASDTIHSKGFVNYSANQDEPYLIASTSGWTGATTGWNTYGFQHRLKTNSSGVPRVTIDVATGEAFSVNNSKETHMRGKVIVAAGAHNSSSASNTDALIVGSAFMSSSAQLFVDGFSRFKGPIYLSKESAVASYIGLTYSNDRLTLTDNADGTAAMDAPDGYYVSAQQVITASRNLTNIGTISSGAITASGSSVFNPTTDMVIINEPSTDTDLQTTLRVGTESGGLFLTTNNAIISKGAYYNGNWYATAATGSSIDFTGNNRLSFNTFSGATVGNTVTLSNRGYFDASGLTVIGAITANTLDTGHGANELYPMNQAVRTTDSPTFASLNVTGDLNITGDINSVNVTDLDVVDKTITVASGAANSAAADGAGLVVGGAGAHLKWDNGDSKWGMNKSLQFDDTPTTTNQNLGIYWTGFDKEGTTDFSDIAYIRHTTNIQNFSTALEIKSNNDSNDGILFTTHGDSKLKHNSHNIATETWVNAQGFLTSVTESDTLNTVTSRGNTTSNSISTGAITTTGGTIAINNAGGPSFRIRKYNTTDYDNVIYYDNTTSTSGLQNRIFLGRDGDSVTIRASGNALIEFKDSGIESSRDIDLNGNVLDFQNTSTTNRDHIWHDDAGNFGRAGTFHFASDTSRKNTGNAAIIAGAYGIGTTEVITNSRNLVNIGTISSGAITSSGGLTASGTVSTPQVDYKNGSNIISAEMLSTDTLSFTGDSGQLFSITDSSSGTIFSVNDISGVPSIEVEDDGTIRLAETFGNVGIGTDNPSTKLEVVGGAMQLTNGTSGTYIKAVQTTNTANAGFFMASGNANWFNLVDTSGNYQIYDGDAAQIRLQINGSGNVGIGATPSSYKLEVAGTIHGNATSGAHRFVTTSSEGPIMILKPANAQTGKHAIFEYRSAEQGSANYLMVDGTSTWFATYDGAMPSDESKMVRISPNNSLNPSIQIGDSGSDDAQLVIDNTIRLSGKSTTTSYINAGNFGIGDTSPAHKLTVSAPNNTTAVGIDIGSNAHFDFQANSTSGYTTTFNMDNSGLEIGHDSVSRSLALQTGGLDRLTIGGSGNTTVSGNLEVQGADVTVTANIIHAGDTDTYYGFHGNDLWRVVTGGAERIEVSNSGIIINDGGADYDFRVESDNDQNAFFIQGSDGDVGIGNNSPQDKLHILAPINSGIRLQSPTAANSYGDENRIEFHMSNETGSQATGNPAARVSSYLQGNDNRYGLKFYTRTNSSTFGTLMTLTGDKKVGIGTTTPADKLEIRNNHSQLRLTDSDDNKFVQFSYSGGKLIVRNNNSGTSVNQFTLDENNRFGIGTISPSYTLDVSSGAANDARIRAFTGNSNAGAYFRAQSGLDGFYGLELYHQTTAKWFIGGYGNNRLGFYVGEKSTAANEKMSLTTAGNFGIGTTAPSTKLHLYTGGVGSNTGVTDMLRIELNRNDHGTTPSGPAILFKDQDTNNLTNEARIKMMTVNDTDYGDNDEAASNLVFETTNGGTASDKMIITGRGHIGINNMNPPQPLSVGGTITVTGTTGIQVASLSRPSDAGRLELRDSGGTTRIELNGSGNSYFNTGNLGVGTTNPAQKLHVAGNAEINGSIYLDGSTTGSGGITYGTSTQQPAVWFWGEDHTSYPGQVHIIGRSDNAAANSGEISFWDYTGSSWNRNMVIRKDGKVGIGVDSPAATLHIQNTSTNSEVMRITTTGDDPDRHMYFQSDHIYSSGQLHLGDGAQINQYRASIHKFLYGTSNAEAMRIDSSGRVGIGQNNPSAMLHIHDNAAYSSMLFRVDGQYNDVKFNGGSSGTNGVWEFENIGTWAQTRFYVQDANNDNARLTFDFRGNGGSNKILAGTSGGRVGIGTTNPLYPLQVTGSIYTNGGNVYIDSGNKLVWGNSTQWIEGNNDTNIEFGVESTVRARLVAEALQVEGGAGLRLHGGARSDAPEGTYYNWFMTGQGTDTTTWKKVCDVAISTGLFRALAMSIQARSQSGNFGSSVAVNTEEYTALFYRSAGTQDDQNNATLIGHNAHDHELRIVKTSTGNYEVQAKQKLSYRDLILEIYVLSTNGGTVTIPTTGTNGSTSGTVYNITRPTNSTAHPMRALPRIQAPALNLKAADGDNTIILDDDSGRGRARFYRNNSDAYGMIYHDGTNFNFSTTAGDVLVNQDTLTLQYTESEQTNSSDSISVPSASAQQEAIQIRSPSYQDGRYTTQIAKIDRSGGLPLYFRESLGTANSYTNRMRIGTHGRLHGDYVTETFGSAMIQGRLAVTSGEMLRRYEPAWSSGTPEHTVLYNSYKTALGDYTTLKTPGNSGSAHGVFVIGDDGAHFGRTNLEVGDVVANNSATAPFDSQNWGRIDNTGFHSYSGITASGDITTTGDIYINGGRAIFDTDTGTQPFQLNRIGISTTLNQALRVHVDDSNVVFESEQDETDRYGGYQFNSKHGTTVRTRLAITAGNHSEVTMYANNGNGAWRWDGTNLRQGINKTAPDYTLDVAGTINGSNLRIGTVEVISSDKHLQNIAKFDTNLVPRTFALPNTSGTSNTWMYIGQIDGLFQHGATVLINLHSNSGYNANGNQNAEAVIRFKTSNGSSNDGGFYGDCQYYLYGQNGNTLYEVRVVQINTGRFQFYGKTNAHTGVNSIYTVSHSAGTWTNGGSHSTTAPTGTQITATKRRIFTSGFAQNEDLNLGTGDVTCTVLTATGAGSSIKAPLYIAEQNSTGEGGEITLNGSNGNTSHTLDTVNGTFRIFDANGTMLSGTSGDGVNAPNGFRVNGTLVIDVNKRLLVSDGSASAPYMTFAADTNTGFYRIAADEIGFSTGGVHRVKLSSQGFRVKPGAYGNYFEGESYNGTNTVINLGYTAPYGGRGHLSFGGTGLQFYTFLTTRHISPCDDSGTGVDDTIDLGASAVRFDDVYATNGTIQTSDQNEKQDIQELTEAEARVAVACKGLIRRFRWISSVEEKGDDARYHFGAIAQDVEAAFIAEGLDAGDYGLFIRSTWWEHEGEHYPTAEAAPTGAVEKTRFGIRYNQLFAFIISAL